MTSDVITGVMSAQTQAWQKLKEDTVAIRLKTGSFGCVRVMTPEQRKEIAAIWGIPERQIRPNTEIIDTRNKAYRSCLKFGRWAREYWKINTYPFDDGTRLARKSFVPKFIERIDQYKIELAEAAEMFSTQDYPALVAAEKESRGDRFVPAMYPTDVANAFYISYKFPSLDVNEQLARFMPELSSKMEADIRNEFSKAVQASYDEFSQEFSRLVTKFIESMKSGKKFRKTTVENITQFAGWFKNMDIAGDATFSELVEKANGLLSNAGVETIRSSSLVKAEITKGMEEVSQEIEAHMIDRASRSITF
mgnify:FL=1